MNKRVATTMLVTVATLGIGTLGAQASRVSKAASPVVSKAVKATTIKDAQKKVAQAKKVQKTANVNLAEAKDAQTTTQQLQNSAAAGKATAQKAYDKKYKAVSQAQAIKNQATTKNLNAAYAAASHALKNSDKANQSVKSAQSSVAAKQAAVNRAQTNVKAAISTANNTAKTVTNETNKLNKLKQGTSAAAKAKQSVTVAQTAAKKAQTALNTAKKNLTAKQNSLNAAKKTLAAAKKDAAQKDAAFNKASGWSATLAGAGTRLGNLNVDLREAKSILARKTTIYKEVVADNNKTKALLKGAIAKKKSADQAYNRAAKLVKTLQAKKR